MLMDSCEHSVLVQCSCHRKSSRGVPVVENGYESLRNALLLIPAQRIELSWYEQSDTRRKTEDWQKEDRRTGKGTYMFAEMTGTRVRLFFEFLKE
jgi:hypothetical protein